MNTSIKNIALIIAALALISGGYFFLKNKNSLNSVPNDNLNGSIISTSTTSGVGNGDVIEEESTTTASFMGHYGMRTLPAHEDTPAQSCSIFIVQKSNDPLFTYFSKMVLEGNTINSLDKNGNLLLNIDLDSVSSEIKNKVTNSTEGKDITLNVQKKVFKGKEATACYSFVNILSVKN